MLSQFSHYLIFAPIGLAVGLVLRFAIHRQLERRAWGTGRSALSRSDRREIRRAIREGRPVADRRLAPPAVLYGEQVTSSNTRPVPGLSQTPHWVYLTGRIFFPLFGGLSVILGVLSQDVRTWVSGIALLAVTVLYLPAFERRMAARFTRRDQRLQTFIEANRHRSAKP